MAHQDKQLYTNSLIYLYTILFTNFIYRYFAEAAIGIGSVSAGVDARITHGS